MRLASLLTLLATVAACAPDGARARECSEVLPAGEPRLRCALSLDASPSGAPAGGEPLAVGLFLMTGPDAGTWSQDEAAEIARDGLQRAATLLAPCALALRLETAQVVAAPPSLLDVEGNDPEAWGGTAPEGHEDPDAFNYALDERLAPEPTALFGYARNVLSPGAIAIVVVDRIVFWAAGSSEVVGGLAYPPVVYHHEDDHPERNGVLIAASYAGPGALPGRINGRTVAHELGHMLLDTAQHSSDDDNLMKAGTALTEEQCAQMRQAAGEIYGLDPVVDPRQ